MNFKKVSALIKEALLETEWEMLDHTKDEPYNGEIWTNMTIKDNDYTVCINHDGFVDMSFDDFEDDTINVIVAVLEDKKFIKQIYDKYEQKFN